MTPTLCTCSATPERPGHVAECPMHGRPLPRQQLLMGGEVPDEDRAEQELSDREASDENDVDHERWTR